MVREKSRGRLMVLYDDSCGVCNATARFVSRLDREGRLQWLGFADASARGVGADVPRDLFIQSFHVVTSKGTVSGADAIPYILECVPFGRVPAFLLRRSRFLAAASERLYSWVARNRFRWGERSCSSDSLIPGQG